MATPRYVVPGKSYHLVRRCSFQKLRLRPRSLTNRILLYALALAAAKTGVLIHAICVMSNHVHALATDVDGRLPLFLQEFYRTVAKALNASQGQRENFWNTEKATALPIADDWAMIHRTAYIVANPVRAGLVRRPEEWRGVLLWKPCEIRVRRPNAYFAEDGRCPEEIVLRIVRPRRPAWSTEELYAEIEKAVEARVRVIHAERARAGLGFSGPEKALEGSFSPKAQSRRARSEPIPKVAATEPHAKRALEFVRKKFLVAYRDALRRWRDGIRDVLFPHGTWWMVRHHAAAVAAPLPGG